MKIDNTLKRIRERLVNEEPDTDNKAKEIISEEVFSSRWALDKTYDEISCQIDKFFYKTRTTLNILQPLVDDEDVTEIMVNNYDQIFYEKYGEIFTYDVCFENVEELEQVMQSIAAQVHREVNELNPIVDARLEDGSRVNGVYKNIAVSGPTLTIRKFSQKHLTIEQLIANKTLNEEAAELLRILVDCGYNLFISGGTSSGKTTLINALSECISSQQRVIVIEDSTELKLNSIRNLIQLECKHENSLGKGQVNMSDLIKTSLRMRPDRIIVGEVRGPEVIDMLQAMNTGHDGSMSSGHGNSVKGMLKRIESMYLMGITLDVNTIRAQIAEGIDFIIHIEKKDVGRRIVEISEIAGVHNSEFIINQIMKVDDDNILKFTGNNIMNTYKIKRKGADLVNGLQKNGLIAE